MAEVSFKTTRLQALQIGEIVTRAEGMQPGLDRMSLHMDLSACIAQGCPLDLGALFKADDFNFAHDVFGISRHIDRNTGLLGNCFLPRFARGTKS